MVLVEFRQQQAEPVALVAIVKTTQLVPWQRLAVQLVLPQVVPRLQGQEELEELVPQPVE